MIDIEDQEEWKYYHFHNLESNCINDLPHLHQINSLLDILYSNSIEKPEDPYSNDWMRKGIYTSIFISLREITHNNINNIKEVIKNVDKSEPDHYPVFCKSPYQKRYERLEKFLLEYQNLYKQLSEKDLRTIDN